jgi:hypothetical protein
MRLIETKTLAVAAASIVFTSIPQDGTDLVLLATTRSAVGGTTADNLFLSANSVVSGYLNRFLVGTATTVATQTNANTLTTKTLIGITPATGVAGAGWGSTSVYFTNYTGSTNKSYSADSSYEGNTSTVNEAGNLITAGVMPITTGITGLTLTLLSGSNFTIGTTISLYKVTSGSDGIVTVS